MWLSKHVVDNVIFKLTFKQHIFIKVLNVRRNYLLMLITAYIFLGYVSTNLRNWLMWKWDKYHHSWV
jgi:hypothetical protein